MLKPEINLRNVNELNFEYVDPNDIEDNSIDAESVRTAPNSPVSPSYKNFNDREKSSIDTDSSFFHIPLEVQGQVLDKRGDLKNKVANPLNEESTHFLSGISMQILGGFFAVIGIAAVAVAFAVLNAVPGFMVVGFGMAALFTGVGLFSVGKNSSNNVDWTLDKDMKKDSYLCP